MPQNMPQFGRQEYVGQLGPNEQKVWSIYEDFLACIDTTIVEPAQAALVAVQLAAVLVNGYGLANLEPGGGKP